MKRSMLYVMCVSWEWIYQRPQIIAERLADDFDMTVVYPRMPMDCSPKVEDTEKISQSYSLSVSRKNKNGRKIFCSIQSEKCF